MIRLGINGFGRIGRCVLRALEERKADGLCDDLTVVAINEPAPPKSCLLYTSPSPRDLSTSRMPSSA